MTGQAQAGTNLKECPSTGADPGGPLCATRCPVAELWGLTGNEEGATVIISVEVFQCFKNQCGHFVHINSMLT